MANIPTTEEVEAIKKANLEAIAKKKKAQEKLGKDFVLDTYGPGVVPEPVWQKAKVAK